MLPSQATGDILHGVCLDSVVNHALTYDVSVNDPDAMASHGQRLDEVARGTAACILSVDAFTAAEEAQLRLSRLEGGCGLISAAERSATAFLASVLRLGSSLPVELTEMSPDAKEFVPASTAHTQRGEPCSISRGCCGRRAVPKVACEPTVSFWISMACRTHSRYLLLVS